ncbi:hypothetical protein P153DRAFT_386373 [Dothidotthia symphoricarpi CBS 119687]|uniref:USP domain-containing protein n=1 Tax=Dothidotthia symphoricarpi CBS 119687 TaxID=1392245 RepID=A0A6A6AFL4_9PLEO|nr:uncharacterized protein P153DRAFT_386373 [Dothidotthia symphoricarpi CBS 119687]KAF2129191.1 hypothetical protein P153DRAFT_386373 [Dothidotthia symphoricarpi CBS 119687]
MARTRSAGLATDHIKTTLQKQRDAHASRITKNKSPSQLWKIHRSRPSRNSRGIENAAPYYKSYQNVVHQALMHTPIYHQWISKHKRVGHESTTCILCSLQDIATRYWGAAGATVPIPATDAALMQIAGAAAADDVANFGPGVEGNASDFFAWLTENMMHPAPPNFEVALPDMGPVPPHWNDELDALFKTNLETRMECTVCSHTWYSNTVTQPTYQIEGEYRFVLRHGPRPALLDYIIDLFFNNIDFNFRCGSCHSLIGAHHRTRRIEAAPQILRIAVNIFGEDRLGTGEKYLEPFDVPQQLDLTQRQVITTLPLTYTLSSAIAHGGDGGRTEVFGMPEASADSASESSDSIASSNLDEDESELFIVIDTPSASSEEESEDESSGSTAGTDYSDLSDSEIAVPLSVVGGSLFTLNEVAVLPQKSTNKIDVQHKHNQASQCKRISKPHTRTNLIIGTQTMSKPQSLHRDSDSPSPSTIPFSTHSAESDAAQVNASHHIISVRGPNHAFHISDSHTMQIPLVNMTDNPQNPTDACFRPGGYQVCVLTYTRDRLKGKDKKLEELAG